MNSSETMLRIFIESATKKSIFASFYDLRYADLENDETFSEYVLDFRREEMIIAAKKAGVNLKEIKEIMMSCYRNSTEELLLKISKGLDLAIDETKEFKRKKKEEKK